MTIGAMLAEAMTFHQVVEPDRVMERAAWLLELCGKQGCAPTLSARVLRRSTPTNRHRARAVGLTQASHRR